MSRAETFLEQQTAGWPIRSAEWKAGALAAIGYWFGDVRKIECPYVFGTAAADAWRLGATDGHRIALLAAANEESAEPVRAPT